MYPDKKSKAYVVGGGIASLAAAVYLIKDAAVKGSDISIFEESERMGGSLDARNLSESEGYSMRGIRMFEEKTYDCLFDLMSGIPSLINPGKTLRQEFIEYNKENKTYSKSRLLRHGFAIDSRPLGLSFTDRCKLFLLPFCFESTLEDKEIRSYFTPDFFTSNFWYEFCTVFAFQPWHSLIEFRRYFLRFIQDFPSIDTLESIESSPYNQYEFIVLPVVEWLKNAGVVFIPHTKITNIDFVDKKETRTAHTIYYIQAGVEGSISVAPNDYVFITVGSLVANSATGSMTQAPAITYANRDVSWTLWENIAQGRPEFGLPSVFNTHVDKSQWTSFTITFRDNTFFDLIESYIHKKVTSYGGINIVDSNWLISIVLSYKPYFVNQPDNVSLCWGYGLMSENKGNFVNKKMSECTGREILIEIIHHLGFEKDMDAILKSAVCIPCAMPYVTSLFLPRKKTDRPVVVPKGSTNFAFLGQYCEIPSEVVFTVEHSVRSAQIAVYNLLKVHKKVSPLYKGTHHIGVLLNALKTLLR